MHEPNFEKQVRSQMESLRLEPAPPVWIKVEEQIRSRENRRRVLFLLLLPLLALGGALGWWLLRPGGSGLDKAAVETQRGPGSAKRGNRLTQAPAVRVPAAAPSRPDVTRAPLNAPALSSGVQRVKKSSEAKPVAPVKTFYPVRAAWGTANETVSVAIIPARVGSRISTTAFSTDPATHTGDTLSSRPVPTSTAREESPAAAREQADAVPQKRTQPSPSRWEIGIRVRGGISTPVQASPTYVYTIPNTSSGAPGGFADQQPASFPHQGSSYAAGITLRRVLQPRLRLSAGLHYASYSTNGKVGRQVTRDTMLQAGNGPRNVAGYYTGAQTDSYTNRYHYLELPLGVEWTVIRNKPLYVDGGFAVAGLLGSNALHRVPGGLYIRANSLLRQPQLSAYAGLRYRIMRVNRHSVTLGPVLQMHLTRLAKASTSPRLATASLQATVSF